MSARGDFFFTPSAVRTFQAIYRLPTYEAALDRLIAMGKVAVYKKRLESGAETWRAPKPERCYLIAEPERNAEDLIVVVDVWPEHGQRPRRGRP